MEPLSTHNPVQMDARLDSQIESIRMMPFKQDAKMSERQMREAANQFETIMMRLVLKEMRKTVPTEEGLFSESKSSQMYMDIVDDHLAENLAKNNDLGIESLIYDELKERNENFGPNKNQDENGFMKIKEENGGFMELNPSTDQFMKLQKGNNFIDLPEAKDPFMPLSDQPVVSTSRIAQD